MNYQNIRRVVVSLLLCAGALAIWQSDRPKPVLASSEQSSQTLRAVPLAKEAENSPVTRVSTLAPQSIAKFQIINDPGAAPEWAVKLDGEFWRQREYCAGAEASTTLVNPALNQSVVVARANHAVHADAAAALPRISTGTYIACFDGQGMQFSPARPAVAQPGLIAFVGQEDIEPDETRLGRLIPDAATQIRFRTVSIERDGQAFFSADQNPTQWIMTGNTVQGLLSPSSGLVEHYVAFGDGVAVTWVFPDPLPGSGSIRIAATVEGLKYAGETDRGLHFADNSGVSRVCIGQAEAVDSLGNRWALTTCSSPARNGKLVVELPASIQDDAVYPLAVDPIISPEFGMDQPVSSAANQQHTVIARNLTVQFSAPTYSVSASGNFAQIAITMRGKYSGELAVDFATADGTATAGVNYMPVAGHLVFAARKTSTTVLVPIIESGESGTNKTVNLVLKNPTGGVQIGTQSTATLNIGE